MYNVILPLRFGLLRSRDPEMFEWLLQNMDHNEERNRDEEMRSSTERMVLLVAGALRLSRSLAWRIVGILFTNCFEFKISYIDARALYPLVSLINHSCVPNMRHTNLIRQLESEDRQLKGEIVVMHLEAQRTILPNTELTIRYNDYMTVLVFSPSQSTSFKRNLNAFFSIFGNSFSILLNHCEVSLNIETFMSLK